MVGVFKTPWMGAVVSLMVASIPFTIGRFWNSREMTPIYRRWVITGALTSVLWIILHGMNDMLTRHHTLLREAKKAAFMAAILLLPFWIGKVTTVRRRVDEAEVSNPE